MYQGVIVGVRTDKAPDHLHGTESQGEDGL